MNPALSIMIITTIILLWFVSISLFIPIDKILAKRHNHLKGER